MRIQAFALDLDGTLVDSIPDLTIAANRVRAYYGLPPLPEARIRYHVGDGIASLVHRALTDLRDGCVSDGQHAEALSMFLDWYGQHLADHTQPYPTVVDTLSRMKAEGFRVALITNKSIVPARKLTATLGLARFLDIQIGGDSLSEKKPSGLPLLHVAEQFGLPPQAIAMVGDSHNDVRCARQAGALAIAASYGYEDVSACQADFVAASLAAAYEFGKNAIR